MNSNKPSDQGQRENPAAQQPPLTERDFIQESHPIRSLPLWIWIFLLSTLALIGIGLMNRLDSFTQVEKAKRPFLEVTNRDLSVFLYQFPSYMRGTIPAKTGYLPGFNKEEIILSDADQYASAPPELLFLYHTWNRLLASDYIPGPIPPDSFEKFLAQTQLWLPEYWKGAPKQYADLIKSEAYKKEADLQTLDDKKLPKIVRQAYQGWRNYFQDGEAIVQIDPSFGQLKQFLEKHPHYARNYWRNIDVVLDQRVAGLNYLAGLLKADVNSDDQVPKDQLAPFLKPALFNDRLSGLIKDNK